MNIGRQRIALGSCAVVIVVSFVMDYWLLVGDGPTWILNTWLTLNVWPGLLGAALSDNLHQPSVAGFLVGQILQWGAIGYVIGLFLKWSLDRRHSPDSLGSAGPEE